MFKRIWNFDKDQFTLLIFLIKNLIKQFFIGTAIGNLHEFKETWFWLKIHCSYDSKRIK